VSTLRPSAASFYDFRSAFGVRRSNEERIETLCTTLFFSVITIQMNDFTEFDAFQLCRDFARAIAVPLNGGVFARDPVLVTQLRKTIISVYSNFAEGFERDGNREFSQFVSVSRGSVGEARGQLLYAVDFGYLQIEQFEPINSLGLRASQCLGGLMRHLNTSDMRGRKFKFHDDRRR
jgi:four helix bundle protein